LAHCTAAATAAKVVTPIALNAQRVVLMLLMMRHSSSSSSGCCHPLWQRTCRLQKSRSHLLQMLPQGWLLLLQLLQLLRLCLLQDVLLGLLVVLLLPQSVRAVKSSTSLPGLGAMQAALQTEGQQAGL
jgi:hypothetical protein